MDFLFLCMNVLIFLHFFIFNKYSALLYDRNIDYNQTTVSRYFCSEYRSIYIDAHTLLQRCQCMSI